jgi:hypothetical protein
MKTTATILAALLVCLVTTAAHADSPGTPGPALALIHNDDGSLDYGTWHGTLVVAESADLQRDYRWGGSLCIGARDLDIDQQRLLLDAMRSKMLILPYYVLGNGNTRCLTSFIIVAKKSAAADVSK